ncbi:hypothetical protein N7G274_008021 [Stereocaulon virgatum]|uniref:Uncharacterized protein n=1 Tax=Stereocaulon virgatum TaxID=373712 RepID=A0ABR4A7P9_9LECA
MQERFWRNDFIMKHAFTAMTTVRYRDDDADTLSPRAGTSEVLWTVEKRNDMSPGETERGLYDRCRLKDSQYEGRSKDFFASKYKMLDLRLPSKLRSVMEALVVVGVKATLVVGSQDVASRGGPSPRAYFKRLRFDSFNYPATSADRGRAILDSRYMVPD